MARSPLFGRFARTMRIALFCEAKGVSTREGLERAAEAGARAAVRRASRREFLAGVGKLTAAGAVASIAGPLGRALAFPPPPASGPSVGIVGAGLAGLACADELKKSGKVGSLALYEASARAGGRCFSQPNFMPGQAIERGGEFIDNLHKSMLGYVQELGLELEDVSKEPGEVFYFFDGTLHPESAVVAEYRDFVDSMRPDLRASSGAPTADAHNDADIELDNTSLEEYLVTRGAGPLLKQVIEQTYLAEYGREIDEQSSLNFLLFIHADQRSKFTPFGVFSDERWHVVGGNDQIATGLRDRMSTHLKLGYKLVRVRAVSSGIELTFKTGKKTVLATHDAVVLAVPFTVLRDDVKLDANLGIPADQLAAIELLGYGTNAKMMVGFTGRPWRTAGSNGTSYADLAHVQTTWETSPTGGSATQGILTDYSSGRRGATLSTSAAGVQTEAGLFLQEIDLYFPGAFAARKLNAGQIRAVLEHWPSNPLTKGSYTCYGPGQFTTIAGLEGKPVGNLHFAGEHANSFYEWQGFMEGAVLSGLQAASEVLADIKAGVLS